jgi:N-acetyl sugar amidotransferase
METSMGGRSVCAVSVMDDSDPDIAFDAEGVSHHVRLALRRLETECVRGPEGEARLAGLVARIKAEGKGKPYDCVIGLSGGVDSSYVALRARELGLRPIAIHLDNGWNSEAAVANIENLVRTLDIDLHTEVIRWEEIRDLQRSFFLASIPNVEAVTDHAIFAALYRATQRWGTRFILPGANVETESIMPAAWGHSARDSRIIRALHRRYGQVRRLKSYPLMSPWEFLWHTVGRRVRNLPVLNYGPYNKKAVVARLQREVGWRPYPRKHGESRFTRFFQEYYLPRKFGFDKRKAHYSNLIVAGQMTRDEAFAALNEPLYRGAEAEIEVDYVTKKLGFSDREWRQIMSAPPRRYEDYPNDAWLFSTRLPVAQAIKRLARGDAAPAVALQGGVS